MSDFKYTLMGETSERLPDVFSMPADTWDILSSPLPPTYVLTKQDAERFDLLVYSFYRDETYATLVLWYNGIPSKYHLYEGQKVYIPSLDALQTFKKKAWYQ